MQIQSSTIALSEMRFFAHHGVTPQEQLIGCHYVVDLCLTFDCSAAALSDELADTVNYAEVYEAVRQAMARSSRLIEHAAARIARAVFALSPGITALTVRLAKQNPPMGADVRSASVELRCTR